MVDRHHPGAAPTALLQRLGSGVCLTIGQLAADLDLTNRQVSNAAAVLLRRGYLDRMAIGCFQLTDAGLAAAFAGETITSGPIGSNGNPRRYRNSLRQRAWTSMKTRRVFTVPDLVVDAATGDDTNPGDNLQRYLRGLAAVGYVSVSRRRVTGTAPTSPGYKLFALVRDTGPVAPALCATGIHDFNLGEDVLCPPR
ncbi:hypothetical protein [Fuscovulum blasticum]|uniref:hypothetical protein n=1 Tax=Fuscovulum blasticum TaxID=1075 RepID=UPI000D3E9B8D|nr:hypothetical protein [Fuscovulum blasticum]AWD21584.1 hypothetical protein B6K69_07780 [Fuscovulum blasticum]